MSETKEDTKPKTEEEPKADEVKEVAKEVEGEKKEEAKDTTVKEETKESSEGDDEDKTKESSEGDDSKEETKESSEGDVKEETKESSEGDDKEETKKPSEGDDKDEEMVEAEAEAKDSSEEQKEAGTEGADKKPEKKKRGRPPKVKTDGDKQETTTPKKRTEPATPTNQTSSSSKRQRKATTFLSPKNFKSKPTDGGLHIPKGRGPLFTDIAFIKDSISKKKANDPILGELHKFLLGGTKGLLGKGRTPQKHIKPHILSFSGYLPNEIEGDTKEEKEQIESGINERFEVKAAKLKLPLLKAFFDLLGLDRSPVNGKPQLKGELADNLWDFLADPDEEIVCKKSEKKKRGRPAKVKTDDEEAGKKTTKKKRKKNEVVESEEESDDEEEDKDGKPSAKKLQKWVKAYVTCFNLDKATGKHAVQTASDKFGVDMSDRKKDIMDILKEAMLKV